MHTLHGYNSTTCIHQNNLQSSCTHCTMHTHSYSSYTHTHTHSLYSITLNLHYTTHLLTLLGLNRASIKANRRPVLALHPCQSSMQAQIGRTQADSLVQPRHHHSANMQSIYTL